MSDDPYLLSPPELSDAEATALCDFLCTLVEAVDAHYAGQLVRFQERQKSSFRDTEKTLPNKT